VTVAVVGKQADIPKAIEAVRQPVAEAVKPTVVAVMNNANQAPEVVAVVKPAVKMVEPTIVESANIPYREPRVHEIIQPIAGTIDPAIIKLVNNPIETTQAVTEVVQTVPAPIQVPFPPGTVIAAPDAIRVEPATNQTPTVVGVGTPMMRPNTPAPSPRLRRPSDSNIIPANPDVPAIVLTKPDRKTKPSKYPTYSHYDDNGGVDVFNPTTGYTSTHGSPWLSPKPDRKTGSLGSQPSKLSINYNPSDDAGGVDISMPRRSRMQRFLVYLGCEPLPRKRKRKQVGQKERIRRVKTRSSASFAAMSAIH